MGSSIRFPNSPTTRKAAAEPRPYEIARKAERDLLGEETLEAISRSVAAGQTLTVEESVVASHERRTRRVSVYQEPEVSQDVLSSAEMAHQQEMAVAIREISELRTHLEEARAEVVLAARDHLLASQLEVSMALAAEGALEILAYLYTNGPVRMEDLASEIEWSADVFDSFCGLASTGLTSWTDAGVGLSQRGREALSDLGIVTV